MIHNVYNNHNEESENPPPKRAQKFNLRLMTNGHFCLQKCYARFN